MFKRIILSFVSFIFNFFTPKKKRSFFVNVGLSSKNNCEDIINCSGNNSLRFAFGITEIYHKEKITLYVTYLDDGRLSAYESLINSSRANNVDLRFVRGHADKRGLKRLLYFLREYHFLHKCLFWIVGTGDAKLHGKLFNQKIINLNYFISCKNDLIVGKNNRWKYLDGILTTSLLGSSAISSQTGVRLDRCIELGFPRNDSLFKKNKKDCILKWLKKEVGYFPKTIIVYAPTYRDYEKRTKKDFTRALFGYDLPGLENFLVKNSICLVSKLHNLTVNSTIDLPKGVVPFKVCYDFSFYDLLSITDCLITDYSSVGYDYLLLNRPIIYNLYDLEKYSKDRGLSYEPYESFCPGSIVKNAKEMFSELNNVISDNDSYKQKREMLLPIFHKYKDACSCDRVINYLLTFRNKE